MDAKIKDLIEDLHTRLGAASAYFLTDRVHSRKMLEQSLGSVRQLKKYAAQRHLCEERANYETPWLLYERAQHLCECIEMSGASEQLTKCSVLAAQLSKELETWQHTRELSAEEKACIEQALNRHLAASPNASHEPRI